MIFVVRRIFLKLTHRVFLVSGSKWTHVDGSHIPTSNSSISRLICSSSFGVESGEPAGCKSISAEKVSYPKLCLPLFDEDASVCYLLIFLELESHPFEEGLRFQWVLIWFCAPEALLDSSYHLQHTMTFASLGKFLIFRLSPISVSIAKSHCGSPWNPSQNLLEGGPQQWNLICNPVSLFRGRLTFPESDSIVTNRKWFWTTCHQYLREQQAIGAYAQQL